MPEQKRGTGLPFDGHSNLPFDAHSYSFGEANRAVQETVVRRGLFTAPFGEGQFAEAILNEVPPAGSPINDSTPGGILGFPRQEQPDHPRSHVSPGVQDPLPTEPASGPLPGQRGRDGGVMLADGSVVFADASAEPTAGTAPTSASTTPDVWDPWKGARRGDPDPATSPSPARPGQKSAKARRATSTKIGKAVLKNGAQIELIGLSFIALIDSRIESLRQEQGRLNSEESQAAIDRAILDWEELKHKVEAFLETASQFAAKTAHESAVTEKTYSLAEGIRAWWSKRHVQICDKLFDKALQASDVALFGTVLGLCGLAGAEPNFTVAVSGSWFGGKGVADVVMATLTSGKVTASRNKKGRR
jgi:hypothetical protein